MSSAGSAVGKSAAAVTRPSAARRQVQPPRAASPARRTPARAARSLSRCDPVASRPCCLRLGLGVTAELTADNMVACQAPPPPPGPPPPPAEKLPELFPNINGTRSAGQVYPNTLIELPEQGRILVHSSASTHQHGFVSTEPKTWSSILTHEIRTVPKFENTRICLPAPNLANNNLRK